jgi:hypothetical protein
MAVTSHLYNNDVFVPHWTFVPPHYERSNSALPFKKDDLLHESTVSKYSQISYTINDFHTACPICCIRSLQYALRKLFDIQKKPYTAVTVHINNLASEAYEENDIAGLVDLIEVIRLQDSGPAEAARALRKKL